MSAKPALPRLFGPYVLTKAFGTDPLGDEYRAGTAASGKPMKPFLMIRSFNGKAIDGAALLPAMENAVEFLEAVKGTAVARGAVLGIVDDVPFAGIEYVPGRTLETLLGKGRADVVPLPIEHALLIAEKILIALEAGKPFAKGTGAPHGFLVPCFVWVSNDGDTRVFGGGLGPGLVPSLKDDKARAAYLHYIAPEVVQSGKPSTPGDIYSAAAILFECLTGKPIPVGGGGEGLLANAVLALNGNPIPDDIKTILSRGLSLDPAKRPGDVVAYRKELGKLLYGGPYAPSTFNLAFFMHHNFEKSIEAERKELAADELIDPKPLLDEEKRAATGAPPKAVAPPREVTLPSFGVSVETGQHTQGGTPMPKKSGPPMAAIVGALVVVAVGAGIALTRGGKPAPVPVPTAAPTVPAGPTAIPTPAATPTPVVVGMDDPAFQAALQARLKEEEKKYLAQQKQEQAAQEKKRQAELEKAADEARKVKEAEEALKAAQGRADQEEAARLAREAQEARQRQETARLAAEAAVPKTKDGDLVEITQVDRPPSALKRVVPQATAMARQRHVNGKVLLRVLVDENGKSEKVEIIRDTPLRVGLGEASRDALQRWEWTPALKDGKRVKTWVAIEIPFEKL